MQLRYMTAVVPLHEIARPAAVPPAAAVEPTLLMHQSPTPAATRRAASPPPPSLPPPQPPPPAVAALMQHPRQQQHAPMQQQPPQPPHPDRAPAATDLASTDTRPAAAAPLDPRPPLRKNKRMLAVRVTPPRSVKRARSAAATSSSASASSASSSRRSSPPPHASVSPDNKTDMRDMRPRRTSRRASLSPTPPPAMRGPGTGPFIERHTTQAPPAQAEPSRRTAAAGTTAAAEAVEATDATTPCNEAAQGSPHRTTNTPTTTAGPAAAAAATTTTTTAAATPTTNLLADPSPNDAKLKRRDLDQPAVAISSGDMSREPAQHVAATVTASPTSTACSPASSLRAHTRGSVSIPVTPAPVRCESEPGTPMPLTRSRGRLSPLAAITPDTPAPAPAVAEPAPEPVANPAPRIATRAGHLRLRTPPPSSTSSSSRSKSLPPSAPANRSPSPSPIPSRAPSAESSCATAKGRMSSIPREYCPDKSDTLSKSKSPSPAPTDGCDERTLALRKIASVAEENDVVWTKIRGHPYWPAQVVNLTPKVLEQKRFKDALRFRRRLDDTCVQYFGTLQIAWVQKAKTCISWASGVERGLHNVLQSRPVYVDAINEVASYCARLTKYPRGWWCEPPCVARACEFVDRFAPPSHPDFSRDAPVVPAAQKLWATARSEGIAWAKLRGFPHWPVQILPRDVAQTRYPELKLDRVTSSTSPPESPAAWAVGNSGNLSSATVVPCMFFGTAEVACVPSRNMTDFEEGVAEGFVVGSDRYDFEIALGEVYGYLHTPREWPTGYGSGRLWWNAPEFRVDSAGNLRSPENSSVSDEELHPPPEIPKYEFIRRSVWPEGESPPPRTKRSEIPVCSCTPRPSGACSDCSCLNFMSRIICDPATCPAGEFCRNVSFHRRPKPALRPFYTADGRGWGLRTVKPIARGDFVVEYVGEIIDKEECERRLKSVQKSCDAEYYMMEINSDHVLDAHFKGNLSRFINSSCAPNCATQKWIDASTGQTRVGIFAIEDIPGGAEVLYNYCFQDFGLASKKGKRAFTCRCGAPQCCMYEAGEYDRTQRVLGKRVKVRWDDGWYMGTVESYDPVSKDFLVHYDDGDDERLRLGENSQSGVDIAFKLVEDS